MATPPAPPRDPFVPPTWERAPTPAAVAAWIDAIAALPGEARALVAPLDDAALDTPYRAGGWTVRQVIHHLVDSHVNGYVRVRWALTEERPEIKAYAQDGWAALADARGADVALSLDLLDALHARWCAHLRALGPADLARELVHPESGPASVATVIALYAWHGRHHLERISRHLGRDAHDAHDGGPPATRAHAHAESFAATPARLFDLLITPSAICRWWSAARAVVVAEPGGTWAAAWGADEDAPDYATAATIRAFDPPRRMVLADYRYRAASGPLPFQADFETTFTVAPDPERAGHAVLRVEQTGFPAAPEADAFLAACEQGWHDTFAGIRAFLAES